MGWAKKPEGQSKNWVRKQAKSGSWRVRQSPESEGKSTQVARRSAKQGLEVNQVRKPEN